jgi:hypothetical protein
VPLSQHSRTPPPPYRTAPLPGRPLSRWTQLLTVDWIFGGRLRGALSSTIYIKTDLKGTLGVELTDSVCTALRCCYFQYSVISKLWTGWCLLLMFMHPNMDHGVIIPNGFHGICLLRNVWAFQVFAQCVCQYTILVWGANFK